MQPGDSLVTMSRATLAGAVSGAAGLVVFLKIHALWIVPIWFVALPGLLIAASGGAAVGWAYDEFRARLPRRPLTAPAIVGLVAVILSPSVVIAEFRDPMFVLTPSGEAVRAMGVGRIGTLFVLKLLVVSTLVGAAVGWMLEHSRRAAIALALADLAFALGPGHNIPFLGGTPGVWNGIVLLVTPSALSAMLLVELDHLVRAGAAPSTPSIVNALACSFASS